MFFLARAHSHSDWSPTEVAALSTALILAGIAIAAGVFILGAWMRRRAAGREPCPGCGTFLAPGEDCPLCPSTSRPQEGRISPRRHGEHGERP